MKTAIIDVKGFMHACDQLKEKDPELYFRLCIEEFSELFEAFQAGDRVETFDAIIDLIWVLIGLGITMDLPLVEGWNEVANSNFSKMDQETGLVLKNADGKVMKPANWVGPNLKLILEKYDANNGN